MSKALQKHCVGFRLTIFNDDSNPVCRLDFKNKRIQYNSKTFKLLDDEFQFFLIRFCVHSYEFEEIPAYEKATKEYLIRDYDGDKLNTYLLELMDYWYVDAFKNINAAINKIKKEFKHKLKTRQNETD